MNTENEGYDLSEGLAFQVGKRNLGIDYRLADELAEERRKHSMTTNYESFAAYYGGTPAETLRHYAAQSQTAGDPERAAKFIRLAEEMERGVVFIEDNRNSKLSYRRLP